MFLPGAAPVSCMAHSPLEAHTMRVSPSSNSSLAQPPNHRTSPVLVHRWPGWWVAQWYQVHANVHRQDLLLRGQLLLAEIVLLDRAVHRQDKHRLVDRDTSGIHHRAEFRYQSHFPRGTGWLEVHRPVHSRGRYHSHTPGQSVDKSGEVASHELPHPGHPGSLHRECSFAHTVMPYLRSYSPARRTARRVWSSGQS